MLLIRRTSDYLLCLHCGHAGWLDFSAVRCPGCAAPIPGHLDDRPVRGPTGAGRRGERADGGLSRRRRRQRGGS